MNSVKKALLFLLSAAILLGVVFATFASAYAPTEDFPNSGSADIKDDETKIGSARVNRFEDMLVYTTVRMDGYSYSYKNKGSYANGYAAGGGTKIGTHETVTEVAADGTLNTYLKFHFEDEIPKSGSTGGNSDTNATFAGTSTLGSSYYYVMEFDVKTDSTFPGGLGIYAYSRESGSLKHYAKIAGFSGGNKATFANDGVSQTWAAGEWHHITAVYEINKTDIGTSEMKVYVDGKYVGNFLSSETKNFTGDFKDNVPELYVGWTTFVAIGKDTSICLDNIRIGGITSESENLAALFADTDPVTDISAASYPEIAYGKDYVLPTAMTDVEAYTLGEDDAVTTYTSLSAAIEANEDGEIYLNRNASALIEGTAKIYTKGYDLDYTCDTTALSAAVSDGSTAYPQDDFILFHNYSDDRLAVFNYYDHENNLVATEKVPAGCMLQHPDITPSYHTVTFSENEASAAVNNFKSWVAYVEGSPLETTPTAITESDIGKVYIMKGSYDSVAVGIATKAPDGTITPYTTGSATLANAIDAAPSGSVVKLFADERLTAGIVIRDKDVTIDLNGYVICTASKFTSFTVTTAHVMELYSSREGGGAYCGIYASADNSSGNVINHEGGSDVRIGWTDKNGDGVLNEDEKCYGGNLTLTGSTIIQHSGQYSGEINAYGTTFVTSSPDNNAMFMLCGTEEGKTNGVTKTIVIDSCELYVAGVKSGEEFFGFRDTSNEHSIYVTNSLLASTSTAAVDLTCCHETSDSSTNQIYFTNTAFVNVLLSGGATDTYSTTVHIGEGCRFDAYVESDYLVFEDADGNPLSVARITPVVESYALTYYDYADYQPEYLRTWSIDTALLYTATEAEEIATVTWDFGEGYETFDKTESWLIGSTPVFDGEIFSFKEDGTLLSFAPVVTVITESEVTFTAIEYATEASLGLMHSFVLHESLNYQLYIPVRFTSIKTLTIGNRTIDITTLPTTETEDGEYYVLTVSAYAAKDIQAFYDITFSFETSRGTTPSTVFNLGILSYLDSALRNEAVDADTKTLIANILEYAKAAVELFTPDASAEDTAGIDALLDYCQRNGIEAYVAETVADPLDEGDLADAFTEAALNLVSTPEYVFTLREDFSGTVTVGGKTYTVTNGLTEDGKGYILYTPTLAAFNDGVTITIGESGTGSYSLVNYILSQIDITTYTYPIYAEALYNLSEFVAITFVAEGAEGEI